MTNNTLSDETIKKLESITEELNGSIMYLDTFNNLGSTTKKIVIEYDRKSKEKEKAKFWRQFREWLRQDVTFWLSGSIFSRQKNIIR